MTPEQEVLADRVDEALEAMWKGSSRDLEVLVGEGARALRVALAAVDDPLLVSGARVGTWRIERLLGAGGMGVVYEATDPDGKPVAMKVIRGSHRADEFHVRLFQREIRTLSRLQHPGSAAIREAGCTPDGRHYFVMELVTGPALTDYANQRDLSLGARLNLFTRVCGAISYAHQRGVIHRDLKPSNIIVGDDGTPKVLDFGLARLTGADLTRLSRADEPGPLMGTLPYMSPEQIRGTPDDIDIRSDVYALGVILYELLTGRLPFELRAFTLPQAMRAISDRAPAPPHEIRARDLRRVVLKALEKRPTDRYQSAAAMGGDVRRFRAGQPVLARRPGTLYTLSKLIARHKVPFALAVLLVLAVFVFGASMSVLYTRARLAEASAARQAQRAGAATDFLERMIVSADPTYLGVGDVSLRQAVDLAAARLDEEPIRDRKLEAEIRHVLGRTYHGLGLYEQAEVHLRRALELRRGRATAATRTDLGAALAQLGRFEEAEREHRRALDDLDPASLDRARALHNLSSTLHAMGQLEKAEALARESLKLRTRLRAPDEQIAASMSAVAEILYRTGQYEEAEAAFRSALDRLGAGADSAYARAELRYNLATTLRAMGRADDARVMYYQALAAWRALMPKGHQSIIHTLNSLGLLAADRSAYVDSEATLREALTLAEIHRGLDHPDTQMIRVNLAAALLALGELREAELLCREALAVYAELHGPVHPAIAAARRNLGRVLHALGRLERAAVELEQALAIYEQTVGHMHPDSARILLLLAAVRSDQDYLETAAALTDEAVAILEHTLGPDHPRTLAARRGAE